jgi:hypothetical protein
MTAQTLDVAITLPFLQFNTAQWKCQKEMGIRITYRKPIPRVEPPHLVVERAVEINTENVLAERQVLRELEHQDLVIREKRDILWCQILQQREVRDTGTRSIAEKGESFFLPVRLQPERTYPEADGGAVDGEVGGVEDEEARGRGDGDGDGGGAREGARDEVRPEAEAVAARRREAREPRLPAELVRRGRAGRRWCRRRRFDMRALRGVSVSSR